MADARATVSYMKGLSLRTINEVEKILLSLPTQGDSCVVEVSKPLNGNNERHTGDVIASKTLEIREEPKLFVLSPPVKRDVVNVTKAKKGSEFSCISTSQQVQQMAVQTTKVAGGASSTTKTNGSKLQYKVLSDQVRVSPIVSCNGVVLELDVEVNIPNREEKKIMKLEIECPNFVPARIKIGNKWKNIV